MRLPACSAPTLVILATLAAAPAGAHAFLDHADPAVGGSVPAAPHVVRLVFTESVEPKFSKIGLTGPDGQPVAAGPVTVASGDSSELDLPLTGALAPGLYKVSWRVVSTDTHQTEGAFTFEVRP